MNRTVTYALGLIAALLLTACAGGDSTGPNIVSVDGFWTTQVKAGQYDAALKISLGRTSTGAVSGTGMWAQTPVTVSGVAGSAGQMTLTITAEAGQFSPGAMSFSGQVSGNAMTGALAGPKWPTPVNVTFSR